MSHDCIRTDSNKLRKCFRIPFFRRLEGQIKLPLKNTIFLLLCLIILLKETLCFEVDYLYLVSQV